MVDDIASMYTHNVGVCACVLSLLLLLCLCAHGCVHFFNLQHKIVQFMEILFSVIGVIVVICLATPWFLVPLVPLGI